MVDKRCSTGVYLWGGVILCLVILQAVRSAQGASCSNCQDQCDASTGICAGACADGYHGNTCDTTCSVNCKSRKCAKTTGTCIDGCKSGFAGQNCSISCPPFCSHLGCYDDRACMGGCLTGMAGKYCNISCSDYNCKTCSSSDPSRCVECVEGYYGENCDKKCSENCERKYCARQTGNCLGLGEKCKNGLYGDQCTGQCYEHCSLCYDNTTCIECMPGWYGKRCEKKCEDCYKCSRNGLFCYQCSAEYLGNGNCFCHKPETDGQCVEPRRLGECTSCYRDNMYPTSVGCCLCQGSHCKVQKDTCGPNNHTCDACAAGYYGNDCSKRCSPHCKNMNGTCEQQTGNCLHGCEEGWIGSKCDDHCSTFHPHCIKCNNDHKCEACEVGYFIDRKGYTEFCRKCVNCKTNSCSVKTGKCDEGCADAWYIQFDKCSEYCHTCLGNHCYDNGTCANGCNLGFYGETCQNECPSRCRGQTCDMKTGRCSLGCVQGYYDMYCYSKCDLCLGDICTNDTTGECSDCKPQYHGPFCKQTCDGCIDGLCVDGQGCRDGCKPGLYGQYCNISCDYPCLACDQSTGQCLICTSKEVMISDPLDCKLVDRHLWRAEFSAISSCPHGKFGSTCSMTCPGNCFHRNGISACDKYTGKCLMDGCKDGLYGYSCNMSCPSRCGPGTRGFCDRSSGLCTKGCQSGRYGILCDKYCIHCANSSCDQETGLCLHGCKPGWTSKDCTERMKMTGDEKMSTKTLLLVVLIPSVLVILVIALIMKLYCIRKNKSRRNNRYMFTKTTET